MARRGHGAAYLVVRLLLLLLLIAAALRHNNLLLAAGSLHQPLHQLAWLAGLDHDRSTGCHALRHDGAPLHHALRDYLSRRVHDALLHDLALLVQGDHVAWTDLFHNLALLVHLHHLLALGVHLHNLLALLVNLHHLLPLWVNLDHLLTLTVHLHHLAPTGRQGHLLALAVHRDHLLPLAVHHETLALGVYCLLVVHTHHLLALLVHVHHLLALENLATRHLDKPALGVHQLALAVHHHLLNNLLALLLHHLALAVHLHNLLLLWLLWLALWSASYTIDRGSTLGPACLLCSCSLGGSQLEWQRLGTDLDSCVMVLHLVTYSLLVGARAAAKEGSDAECIVLGRYHLLPPHPVHAGQVLLVHDVLLN